MKHLQTALKIEKQQQSRSYVNESRIKSKSKIQIWSLDPDFIEQGSEDQRDKFISMARDILNKKFQNEKYLEQETFREILLELNSCLSYLPSQLQRLTTIEDALHHLSQSFLGQMKNYLKHFQSLLDSKIRKIKRKEKRTDLNQFERFAKQEKESPMKRKTTPFYINEEERAGNLKQRKGKGTRLDSKSKRSFGTVGSASNQNESGSGKNISGSDSKSGEGNALAVLLANVGHQDKKPEKARQNQKEEYDFSSIIGASITVRHRSPTIRVPSSCSKQIQKTIETKIQPQQDEDKDEAFIFHRPKPSRRTKL